MSHSKRQPEAAGPPLVERISDRVNTLVERLLVLIGAAICLILFAQVLRPFS